LEIGCISWFVLWGLIKLHRSLRRYPTPSRFSL
jgi:hypothetical protein